MPTQPLTFDQIQTMSDDDIDQLNKDLTKKIAKRVALQIIVGVSIRVAAELIIRKVTASDEDESTED